MSDTVTPKQLPDGPLVRLLPTNWPIVEFSVSLEDNSKNSAVDSLVAPQSKPIKIHQLIKVD